MTEAAPAAAGVLEADAGAVTGEASGCAGHGQLEKLAAKGTYTSP